MPSTTAANVTFVSARITWFLREFCVNSNGSERHPIRALASRHVPSA
jgi:hypothetical protein